MAQGILRQLRWQSSMFSLSCQFKYYYFSFAITPDLILDLDLLKQYRQIVDTCVYHYLHTVQKRRAEKEEETGLASGTVIL